MFLVIYRVLPSAPAKSVCGTYDFCSFSSLDEWTMDGHRSPGSDFSSLLVFLGKGGHDNEQWTQGTPLRFFYLRFFPFFLLS